MNYRPTLQRLECRLTPSSMALDGGGNLSYQSAPGETNNLTVSYDGQDTYTFSDSGALIDAPTDPGWTGSGTNTVTVSLPVSGITISVTGSPGPFGHSTLLESTAAPVTVSDTGNVWVNGNRFATAGLGGITADVTVTAAVELFVSNYGGTSGDADVQIGASTITGLGPNGITINFSGVTFLRVAGSNAVNLQEGFTVTSPVVQRFQLDGDAGPDSITVASLAAGTAATINGGAGNDSVTIDGDANAGTLTVDTGTGANTITVNTANPQDVRNTWNGSVGTLTSPDWAGTIYYRSTGGTVTVDVV